MTAVIELFESIIWAALGVFGIERSDEAGESSDEPQEPVDVDVDIDDDESTVQYEDVER